MWHQIRLAQSAGTVEYTTDCISECPGYNIKPPDGEAQALDFGGIWSTPALPLLSGLLWSWVAVPDRVLSMSQIEQTMCANKWLILNFDSYSNAWNYSTTQKKSSGSFKNVINKMSLQITNIFNIYV